MPARTLAVILARAGSRGLPRKNILPLAGRPMIAHTLAQAKAARGLDALCVSTDLPEAAAEARHFGVFVVDRPPELATDTARVDDAARHAVERYERACQPVSHVVLLYANVPVRAPDIIDRAVAHLLRTGADSVRSLSPVGKQHPDWLHRLEGDRMVPFRANAIHRRQDLEPLYYHDGAVVALTREALFNARGGDPHAMFGRDRRGLLSTGGPTVDVDTPDDLRVAEAMLGGPQPARPACVEPVRIGDRQIGQRRPVYIVAEAGVNHDGRIDRAHELIAAAAAAGADAVKFQVFSAERLAGPATPACAYQQAPGAGASDQQSLLKRLELEPAALPALRDHARARGLDWLATPFGLPELRLLVETLQVPAVKIASPDLIHVPLLAAAARSGLPLILSTGAATAGEIDRAVDRLRRRGAARRLILLHCVSSYPTPLGAARLRRIRTLTARYGLPVGFSDHTASTATGALAVMAGAVMLEKHLTLDRAAPGPDHFFSLEPRAFADYVRDARRAEGVLGDGRIDYAARETEVRARARGRLVTARPIAAGQRLTEDVLLIQRPADGISPARWSDVIGRPVNRDLPANTPLAWSMLAPPPPASPSG